MIKFRLFNASPGDVADERKTLAEVVVPELGRILDAFASVSDSKDIELEAIRWETHTWPDVGADAQDVINKQLTDFDIFVGVMWKRFGTPTKRSGSGTGEEFERAFELYREHSVPRIMFYFRTTPFYPKTSDEIEQFGKVFEFKERLAELGVRYWEYDTSIEFERYVREHLLRQILDLANSPSASSDQTEAPGGIPDHLVFLSYSPEDRQAAQKLSQNLSDAGARTWLDQNNLLPGQVWQQEIRHAIRSSNVFLVLLSTHVVRKTGYIQKEIKFALDEMDARPQDKTYIIPVRLDNCQVPDSLAGLQWVDLFPDWNAGLDSILRALRSIPK